ncbi:MAG: 2Fe-2S iron-sulfur cluster-binding protein, partial [Planctomycetota bacterium]|nr:2Fe-2S iron-sulfur cluster-binding protein [Planctomycetota bacterium]
MAGSSNETLRLTLNVWRQAGPEEPGRFDTHRIEASPDMSFLEMLDVLNGHLQREGHEPVAFDHDCREGICGMCSLVINGQAHGPD